MYHHVRGQVVYLSPTLAVLETGGVGFEIRIPLSTHDKLRGLKEAKLLTHLHVREDDLKLFGFATAGELDLFRLLLSVAGVGPSIALAALSALSPAEVAASIAGADHKTLQRIKGVGKKLAERIVLELGDRVAESLEGLRPAQSPDCAPGTSSRGPLIAAPGALDAVLGLVALGFERRDAEQRVLQRLVEFEQARVPADAEALIKACLRRP